MFAAKRCFSSGLLRIEALRHYKNVQFNGWTNRYCSQNISIPKKRTYTFNCYGFVNHCVKNVSPKAYNELTHKMNYTLAPYFPPSVDGQPCPFNLNTIFKLLRLTHWETIQAIADIKPGDIISYVPPKYKPPRLPEVDRLNTGTHVMIVDKVVKKTPTATHLMIIDSTRSPHCKLDTRFPKGSGIGKSPVVLKLNRKYVNVQWTLGKRETPKELVIARLNHPLV